MIGPIPPRPFQASSSSPEAEPPATPPGEPAASPAGPPPPLPPLSHYTSRKTLLKMAEFLNCDPRMLGPAREDVAAARAARTVRAGSVSDGAPERMTSVADASGSE